MSGRVCADLAQRLRKFKKEELDDAAKLLERHDGADLSLKQAEHVATEVWDLISRTRDRYSFGDAEDLLIGSLEAEMAGRALVARQYLQSFV